MKEPKVKEIDQYVCETKSWGSSLVSVIPSNHVKFAGLKKGDKIKVWFRKLK